MKARLFSLILLLAFFCCQTQAQSQTKNVIGAGLNYEKMGNLTGFQFGIYFEQQFSTHFGYELGLNSKNLVQNYYNVNIQYASLPLMLKCYTNIVDVSLGGNIDYYLGWKTIASGHFPEGILNLPPFNYGLIGKISKDIYFSKSLVIEPSIGFNYLINSVEYNNTSFLTGINIKYLLP